MEHCRPRVNTTSPIVLEVAIVKNWRKHIKTSSYPITWCRYNNHTSPIRQRRPFGWTMTSIAICSCTLFFSSFSPFLLFVSLSSPSTLFEFGSTSMWICFFCCEDSKAWILWSWSQIIHFANTTQFIRQPFFSQTKPQASALFMRHMLSTWV